MCIRDRDDYDRGVLSQAQEARLAEVAAALVRDLAEVATEELHEAQKSLAEPQAQPEENGDAKAGVMTNATLDGIGCKVVSIGARSKLDDVAAAMLGQIMAADGAEVTPLSYVDLTPTRLSLIHI